MLYMTPPPVVVAPSYSGATHPSLAATCPISCFERALVAALLSLHSPRRVAYPLPPTQKQTLRCVRPPKSTCPQPSRLLRAAANAPTGHRAGQPPMPTHSAPAPDAPAPAPAPAPPRHSRPQRFSRNPFRRRRRHHPAMTPDSPNDPLTHLKPIYIYPGLLRIVRDKAIALDNQCPAVHYKCRECRRDHTTAPGPPCAHTAACSICLDEFHAKDLVRRLPCNLNHVFHSKCILDWFISHHRCPLCNEPVTNNPARPPLQRGDHRVASPDLHASPTDPPFSELRRGRSYRAVPTFTMDRSREARLPPQERRLSDATRETSPQNFQTGELPAIEQTCQDEPDRPPKQPQPGEKGKKKGKGPRRYSYIVHDNVRMELNPVIPV